MGTLLNVITIIVGGVLGTFFGDQLPERVRTTVVAGLGLFTTAYGASLFLKSENTLIVVISVLIGALLGEWWQIEEGLKNLGGWLERVLSHGRDRTAESQARFIRGFLTASLVFVIGPMAILGSIQDGLTGDYSTLGVKAILDGFAALAFASSLGVGVIFSFVVILVYQGGITLLAAQLQNFFSTSMMNEMSAVGGVLLLGIGMGSLLELKKIRTGNFLPALAVAPLLVWLLQVLGVTLP